jgi:formate transporter
MDNLTPAEVFAESLQLARKKAQLPVSTMLIRGALAGAFLGYATSLAILVGTQGLPPIVGAVIFPAGFVMLVLLGFELATGNFALLPIGLLEGEVTWRGLVRNWAWVYLGNLIGCLLYAGLYYLAITNMRTTDGGALAAAVRQIAEKKTLAYMSAGGPGWMAALVKAILCNWMVTVGAVLALVSRSTIGKIAAMWLPILTFFALGYEHSIVNMYVIPAGMLSGAHVSLRQWWIWNQIPVTIGNVIGGAVFTGLALYLAHGTRKPALVVVPKSEEALEPGLRPPAEMTT